MGIDNVAEGVVIRKLQSLEHCLFKIKSKKFCEIEEATSQKGMKKKSQKNQKRAPDDLSKRVQNMKEVVLQYFESADFVDLVERCVNENRFQAVESKIGKLCMENAKDIIKAMRDDVFEELQQEATDVMNGLDRRQNGKVRGLVAVLVQVFFKPKMDQ